MNPATTSKGIDILMAVHKPDRRFLEKQVDSIRRQSHTEWRLLMMLDGEHPDLIDTLSQWSASDPRIRFGILPDHSGCCRTFEAGLIRLKNCQDTRELIALADQDDIWEPRKLEALVEVFTRHPDTLMSFCDSSIIDDKDQPVAGSLHASEGRAHDFSLVSLWARNSISGHAQLFRRDLLDQCVPFPGKLCDSGMHHDHWLALAAAHSGVIHFVDRVLVHHRLHDCNQIGPRIGRPARSGGGLGGWMRQNHRLRSALGVRHGFLRSLPTFPNTPVSRRHLLSAAAAAALRGNLPAAGIFLRAFCGSAASRH